MNPERKAEVVAALRSGKYQQGRNYLAKRGSDGIVRYCCLGVMCELAVRAGAVERLPVEDTNASFAYRTPGSDDGNSRVLVEGVISWLGIDEERFGAHSGNPSLPASDVLRVLGPEWEEEISNWTFSRSRPISLADLNDLKVPLEKIADVIEECL